MKCPSVNAGTLVWALALVCFIKATSSLADETSISKSNEDGNPQVSFIIYYLLLLQTSYFPYTIL